MNIYTDLTKKALRISFDAHKDQVDKSGLPYVYHPYEVASTVEGEYEICVALLHDVIEDTDVTLDDLAKDFPPEVIIALQLLTHDDEISYFDYIRRIRNNEIARTVKLADLKHNSNLARLNNITETDVKRAEKYKKAYQILIDAECD